MSKTVKLTETQIAEAVALLDGWQLRDGKLRREFKFKNFVEAWVSVLFIPYLLPIKGLQIAEFACRDTLNSVNTYTIGV
ncbi:MAG: 4a-hydroxytetrahydrobiopterin dehydratase [Planctomycetes bacterium]|nr:4a-hydroxytetrahydrobiopterin dehydratase [Planctomycetota bacterium]MCH8963761.1 4a-hydroxytetrahydrobiopterin dehydratase [Planctomycetota bacterium]